MTENGDERARRIEVFAVSCKGCRGLAETIGLPVACLCVASEVESAIETMNEAAHAGWTLWPEGFQPFKSENGWQDWHAVALGSGGPIPNDLFYEEGRFGVGMPAQVDMARFEAALDEEFRRFASTDHCATPRWLVAQSDAGRPRLVLPRYTSRDPHDFRAGAQRVEDLFVIPPTLHVPPIARAIIRARESCTGRRGNLAS